MDTAATLLPSLVGGVVLAIISATPLGLYPAPRAWRQVEQATAEWVHWFNYERLHSSIGDIPPAEYEEAYDAGAASHRDPAAA